MSSNFERLQKIINQAYAENFMWNLEICQDAPSCGQDNLVLMMCQVIILASYHPIVKI